MRYLFGTTARYVLAIFVLALAMPGVSAAQTRTRGGGSGETVGRAVPRSEAPAPAAEPAPAPAPAPASEASPAPRRTSPAAISGAQATPRTTGARPREGRPTVGTAVPRGSVPRPPQDDRPVVVPVYYGSYWPWGFGGLGYGSYYGSYYGGFYDPFYRGYGYPGGGYYGYGYPQSVYNYPGDGELRLKIKPRDAQVFVDGYYVGIVDDFDGVFQRLHLEPGPHRIEVRAPGYETLTFDVQIRFDDTTKFEGDLRRLP
jgi:PEGA domain